MINIGIIGIGPWGRNYLKTLENNTDAIIVSCLTKGNDENLEYLKKSYPKIRLSKNLEEFLDDEKIRAVIVATSTDSHFKIAKKSLAAGKHVLLEKPPAKNSQDFNELARAALNSKLVLTVDNIYLYEEAYIFLKDRLRNQKIDSIKFEWSKYGTFKGDIFWELVYHGIYIIQELVGVIKQIKIVSSKASVTETDIVELDALSTSGTQVKISINRVSKEKQRLLTVLCENESYKLKNNILFHISKDGPKIIFKSKSLPLNNVVKEFISRIKSQDYRIDQTLTTNTIKTLETIQ